MKPKQTEDTAKPSLIDQMVEEALERVESTIDDAIKRHILEMAFEAYGQKMKRHRKEFVRALAENRRLVRRDPLTSFVNTRGVRTTVQMSYYRKTESESDGKF